MSRRFASLLVAIGVWLAAGQPADAAIGSVDVSPIVAPAGATVTVTGAGCTGTVHVTATGFLFPAPPAVVADTSVSAAADGTWTATFPMPAVPAYVIGECGGATSGPVVIAPSDVALGSLAPAAVSNSTVLITMSPLVNGSRFGVYTTGGALLGSAVVAAGVGSVSLPRSLGPAKVIAVGLRQQDPGFPFPYVPLAAFVQLPLPATTTIAVAPPVSAAATIVTASGLCSGTAHLTVLGRVNGWYDHAPIFVDAHPAVTAGHHWSATFPMPTLPSFAQIACSAGGVVDLASTRISPAAGDLPSLVPFAIGGDVGAILPSQVELDTLHAYTSTGETVAMTITSIGATATARLSPPSRPVRIVIVGIELLGENAEALQNSRVQAWTVDAAGNPASTPSPRTIPLPATDAEATTPSPARERAVPIAAVALGLGSLLLALRSRPSRRRRTMVRKY